MSATFIHVDPRAYDLAATFVEDLLQELDPDGEREFEYDRLVRRAAEAIQQAIEDECTAIRQELEQGR